MASEFEKWWLEAKRTAVSDYEKLRHQAIEKLDKSAKTDALNQQLADGLITPQEYDQLKAQADQDEKSKNPRWANRI